MKHDLRILGWLRLCLLLLLAGIGDAAREMSSSDRAGDLIGWMGETHQVPRQPIAQTSHTRGPLQVLSWERRAFLYSGFLTLGAIRPPNACRQPPLHAQAYLIVSWPSLARELMRSVWVSKPDPEECDHLISVATPRMSRSGVWMPTQAAP